VPENCDFLFETFLSAFSANQEVWGRNQVGILQSIWELCSLSSAFAGIELTDIMFVRDTLNDFISDGQKKHGD
jgi:hypothetical protein